MILCTNHETSNVLKENSTQNYINHMGESKLLFSSYMLKSYPLDVRVKTSLTKN